MPRYFTPEEANELLPTVRPLVEQMVAERRAYVEAVEHKQGLSTMTAGNGGGFPPGAPAEIGEALDAAAQAVTRTVEELISLGLQIKDLDTGLVDFPALRNGEQVLLCWQLGEDKIEYWHTLEGGYAGRRPLPLE